MFFTFSQTCSNMTLSTVSHFWAGTVHCPLSDNGNLFPWLIWPSPAVERGDDGVSLRGARGSSFPFSFPYWSPHPPTSTKTIKQKQNASHNFETQLYAKKGPPVSVTLLVQKVLFLLHFLIGFSRQNVSFPLGLLTFWNDVFWIITSQSLWFPRKSDGPIFQKC